MIRKLFIIGFILVVAFVAWEVVTFPDVRLLATSEPMTTAFMERRKAELRAQGKSDSLEYGWTSFGNISPYLRRAVLVSEDNTFYEHGGVDVQAMRDAIERDWKRKKITHGGSTITQQLAKNLYLSASRNPLRKVKEYFIARSLEKHLSKKPILRAVPQRGGNGGSGIRRGNGGKPLLPQIGGFLVAVRSGPAGRKSAESTGHGPRRAEQAAALPAAHDPRPDGALGDSRRERGARPRRPDVAIRSSLREICK